MTVPTNGPRNFGGWWLDKDALCLVFSDEDGREIYDVDLQRCRTSAEVLDWICQVTEKTWATEATIAGLVRALNHYLQPQATLCSCGQELGPINVRRMLR